VAASTGGAWPSSPISPSLAAMIGGADDGSTASRSGSGGGGGEKRGAAGGGGGGEERGAAGAGLASGIDRANAPAPVGGL
jgi:hypothetical protein